MNAAAALGHDVLLPQPPGGNAAGAALALLVHAGLLLALSGAVDWRVQTPDVVSAELWASVPQIAAPRAETPAPVPPAPVPPPPAAAPAPAPAPRAESRQDADIATERAERRKAEEDSKRAAETERRRLEAERTAAAAERRRADAEARRKAEQERQRVAAEKARQEAAAEEQRLAQQREENLRRIIGQAGGATGRSGTAAGTGGSGSAARSAAPSAAYAGLVVARIRPNIVYTRTLADNAAAEVEVRTAPGGTILSRRLVKSSGHPDWDEAVLRAIDRTPSLPRDSDGRVPPTLLIAFRPNE